MPRDPLPLLHSTFGFPGFRGVQESVVTRVLAGDNTLAVMPTGAGKSLCYQLPSVVLEGTCVVVSPLIALMHDQLRAATAVGIRAATLTSVDTDQMETIARFRRGELDLLYVAPERASNMAFRELLTQAPLALFAIDEAHCVSEWGHDFRPDYRLLRPLLDHFPHVPRLALTATADKVTRDDILDQLGIPREGMIVAGFDRPNIRYTISPKDNTTRQIADLIAETPGAGIVYCQSRAGTEKMAEALARSGRPTRAYHAGLDPQVRARNQADFVASEDMVICATVAFGMGIDKPDVRFVAHAGMPKSIESYYQETGRAGRDGDPAVAHLFWGAEDFAKARQRMSEVEPARQAGERVRLQALGALVETPGCRRKILLRHFGDDAPDYCGNCDNCLNPPGAVDATEVAKKVLSAVFRTGQSFGMGYIEQVLTGVSTERSLMNGHEALGVWGLVSSADELALLKPVIRALLLRDALRANDFGGLEFGPGARGILKENEEVSLILQPKRERRGRGRSGSSAGTVANPSGDPLFEALRAKRRALAAEASVPPYVIFHDSVLREMATLKPRSLSAMANITGVGERKLTAYGDAFLQVIREEGA
ncbi:DNA helicase RecQ [Sphingomonas hylomeconis]|uniref:DNA helicase RecQ n=1 Tax=Sphingomonas hylomeconis TaxID=1395958 RepID=A0ABV7SQV8_9SPHN|nr:DNA helicase RecQ [Sphingomonas hylomeconis]